jgi:hypothetical protein
LLPPPFLLLARSERFHPFTPGLQLTYRIPPNTPDWYAKYNPELKTGKK